MIQIFTGRPLDIVNGLSFFGSFGLCLHAVIILSIDLLGILSVLLNADIGSKLINDWYIDSYQSGSGFIVDMR